MSNQLADRFKTGPRNKQFAAYVARRYDKHGYSKEQDAITYNQEWTPEQRKGERWRWVECPGNGMRLVGKVHEIRGNGKGNVPYFDRSLIDHNGWYTDAFQNETVCGMVYQLPARGGESLYVPAISDPNNDAAMCDFHAITGDLIQAIRNADQIAEWYAADEREYQALESAKSRIEDATAVGGDCDGLQRFQSAV